MGHAGIERNDCNQHRCSDRGKHCEGRQRPKIPNFDFLLPLPTTSFTPRRRQSNSDVNSRRHHPSLPLHAVDIITGVSPKQPIITEIKPQTARGGSASKTTSKSLVSRPKNKTGTCLFNWGVITLGEYRPRGERPFMLHFSENRAGIRRDASRQLWHVAG